MMITHKHLAAEGCRKQDAVVQQDLEQEVAVHFGISEYRKLPIYNIGNTGSAMSFVHTMSQKSARKIRTLRKKTADIFLCLFENSKNR